jgi:hypothetical protein
MTRGGIWVVMSAALAGWVSCAGHVQAQASRAFVSAQGADGNSCSFTAPCRTFQHAHDSLAPGGEIDVLDPAGYGSLVINRPISIQGHGFAGVSATSGSAITINAGPGDKINIRGVLIDGLGAAQIGIALNTGGALKLQDCMIRNFVQFGIRFNAGASGNLSVIDTLVADVGGTGILANAPASGVVVGFSSSG